MSNPDTHSYTFRLADIYDATYHFKDYAKDVGHVLDAIRRHRPGARTLLETAAGTGRYLELLRPHFDSVAGLDLSQDMLDKARTRLPDTPLHQGDMTSFNLGRQFDVVCCLFRSISYCRTRERFHAAVQAMAGHVAPGGILMIEPFFTPDSFWVDRVTLNEYNDDALKISWMYVSKRVGEVAHLQIHYLVGTPAGVEHFTELHEMGLFSREDYAQAFADAGLDLDFDPQGPTGTGLYTGKRKP